MHKFNIPIAKWAIIGVAFASIGASCTLQTPTPSATITAPKVPIANLPIEAITVTAFPTLGPPTPAPIVNIAATNTALPTPVVNGTNATVTVIASATAAPKLSPTTAVLPIYDTHMHYSQNSWNDYSPEAVLSKLKNSEVRRALVSSTSDDGGTLRLYKLDADRIVPVLRPYHDDINSGNWTEKSEVPSYLENKLKTPIYLGIGEIHLNVGTADSTIARKAVQLAVDRNLYVHVHSDAETVRKIFAYAPKAKILWAHVGLSDPPETAIQMLDTYANLWVDTSIREYDIAPNGKLAERWRVLFMKHPDRITIGSDTWIPQRWADYENIMQFNRAWLAQLPREVAEKIAYKNAVRLFGAGKIHFP